MNQGVAKFAAPWLFVSQQFESIATRTGNSRSELASVAVKRAEAISATRHAMAGPKEPSFVRERATKCKFGRQRLEVRLPIRPTNRRRQRPGTSKSRRKPP